MNHDKTNKTYGITGIPAPDAEIKTKTIPYAPGMPFRLEISKMCHSEDPLVQKQWTLFVLALEHFKALPVDQKLSYFQVAGIHGYPETPWDGADAPPPDPTNPGEGGAPFGGYCHHNSISFPTWHRPYMLLFEKRLWIHMHEVIDSWKLEGSVAKEWQKAADSWRMPYWDWARKQTYANDFALPYVLTQPIVTINPPTSSGEQQHPNPLWGFDNPEKDSKNGRALPFGKMPKGKEQWNIKDDATDQKHILPWSKCSGVSRYGIETKDEGKTYTGLEGVNNFNAANVMFKNFSEHWYNPYPATDDQHGKWVPPTTLADAVNRMFSPKYNSTWGTFASTKWWRESEQKMSTGYMSLEYIHNNIHNVAGGWKFADGGVGHMSDVPVAAFDPLFWLHHCNVDRLLAIWQILNWKAWWDTPEPKNKEPNVPDPASKDPLKPFHNIDGGCPKKDFWTSDMSRDWTKLNYQYDDLAPRSEAILPDRTLNEERYISDLNIYIQHLYPSTLEYFQQVLRGNPEFFDPNSKDDTWNDYLINVVYDRYALKGRSYMIEFWLGGEPDNSKSTFACEHNLIGQVYSLAGLTPASDASSSGCANCETQRDGKVLSRAQVPLTIPVISQALDSDYVHIGTTCPRDVERYLKEHLHWKFIQLGGEERDASEFPKTKISVWRGKGKAQSQGPNGGNMVPVYAGYEPIHGPTHGKTGGLRRDDKKLGEDKSGEWDFRRF